MHLYAEDLMNALRSSVSIQEFNICPTQMVTGIEVLPLPFHTGKDTLSDDVFYICEYRMLRRFDPSLEFPPLICAVEPTTAADPAVFRGRRVVAVYNTTIVNLLAMLTEAVFSAASKTSGLTERTGILTQCKSVDELMQAGYDLLQNPLILTDKSQKILSATSEDLIPSAIYRYIVRAEYVPIGRWHQDENQNVEVREEQIFEEGSEDSLLPAVICTPLKHGEQTIGYLNVLQFNRDFISEDRETAMLLANLLALELRQYSDLQPRSVKLKTIRFLRDVLDNIAGDPKEIMSTKQELGLQLEQFLYTIAIFAKEISFSAHINYLDLAESISGLYPGCHSFLYRDGIIVLLNEKKEVLDMETFLEPLVPLLKKHRLVAGVSNPFTALHQMREYTSQARKAISLGSAINKNREIFCFSDYVVHYMAETCLKSISFETLVPPGLIRLIMHDRESGSELVKTLAVYLKCSRSKPKTSEAMFLHENTIRYRISQIQKIIRVDINDDETALKYMLAFKLMEYKECCKGSNQDILP